VVADVREELAHGSPVTYELAVLGTVIRHASVLGCYLLGHPCFGRTEPVRRFSEAVALPRDFTNGFMRVYSYRLALEGRRSQVDRANQPEPKEWVGWAECIVDRLGDLCHG
jgi:hypothetical protein